MLNEEFNSFRGLKPVKIFVTGPPASGKTHFGKQLAKQYNLPHIQVKEVIENGQSLQNELGEEIRDKIEKMKD
jgi:adenylate kinase family enzyme